MKPMLRKLTAELPQIDTRVTMRLQGSGQLQQAMEDYESGSFGMMLSGVKSDMISLVHGDFRHQFMQFFLENGSCKAGDATVEVGSSMSDADIHFEVYVRLAFTQQIPATLRQNAANSLATNCLRYAIMGASQARTVLSSIDNAAVSGPTMGEHQVVNLPPEVMHQLLAQQGRLDGMSAASLIQASGSSDSSPGPGQYL